jgi:hypothetical protein
MLGAQVDAHTSPLGRREPAGDTLDIRQRHVGAGRIILDRNPKQRGAHLVEARAVRIDEGPVVQVFADDEREHRQQQECVGSGFELQMDVGHPGRLGAPRIDHHHGPCRILADVAQYVPGVEDAMGLVGVAADEDHVVGVLDILRGVAVLRSVQAAIDPEVTGLLLGQRAVDVAAAHRPEELAAVDAAEMIALAAAADQGERIAAMGSADGDQAPRDVFERLVPANANETAVWLALQRVAQAIGVILVVVQTGGLVAQVALRARVSVVSADLLQLPPVCLHFEAAVAGAQDACSLLRCHGNHLPARIGGRSAAMPRDAVPP